MDPTTTTGFAPSRGGILDDAHRRSKLHALLMNMRAGAPGSVENFLEGLREGRRQTRPAAIFEEFARAFADELRPAGRCWTVMQRPSRWSSEAPSPQWILC